jgi:hypothetical protein
MNPALAEPATASWRARFPLIICCVFFVLMAIGFSDNWLFDVGQPSNRDPKYVVHGLLAFAWFALLVAQTALVGRGRIRHHRKLGLYGLAVFVGMTISTGWLYFHAFVLESETPPLAIMVFLQWVVGTLMICGAFAVRRHNREGHREGMLLGTLLLMQPSIDRTVGHLFDAIGLEWLVLYALLFGAFGVYLRWRGWRLAVAFATWLIAFTVFIVASA